MYVYVVRVCKYHSYLGTFDTWSPLLPGTPPLSTGSPLLPGTFLLHTQSPLLPGSGDPVLGIAYDLVLGMAQLFIGTYT